MSGTNPIDLAAARTIPGLLGRLRDLRRQDATRSRGEVIGRLNEISERLAVLLVTASRSRATTAVADQRSRLRDRQSRRQDVSDLGRTTGTMLRTWKQERARSAKAQGRRLAQGHEAGHRAVATLLARYAGKRLGHVL